MANLNRVMGRLQIALLNKGVKVKVNARQFFYQEKERIMTCYSVTERKWSDAKRRMTDQEVLKTCSTVEVVKFLAKRLEELENGPDS